MPVNSTEKHRQLMPRCTPGSKVLQVKNGAWRLVIQPGPAGNYRLAQLDDYAGLKRRHFPWKPPISISLRARACTTIIPGTWGFGFWNDPFAIGTIGGAGFRLPALPNAAWFFFASSHNHLSLRDDVPGNGALAAIFRSPIWSPWVLAPGMLLTPLLVFRRFTWLARSIGSHFIAQDAVRLESDPAGWHTYRLDWEMEKVIFFVDDQLVLETPISPHGPLGFVLWVDNQYAAFPPNGRVKFGSLDSQEEIWIEVDKFKLVN